MMEKFLVFMLVFIQIYNLGHSLTCYKCQPDEGETTCKENINSVCDDASKCYNIEGLTHGQSVQVSIDYHIRTLTAGRGCVPLTATTIATAVETTTSTTTSINSTTTKKLSPTAPSATATTISLTADNYTNFVDEEGEMLKKLLDEATQQSKTKIENENKLLKRSVKYKRSVLYAHYKRDVNLENAMNISSTTDEIPINVTTGCNNVKFNETLTVRLCLCDTEKCNSATTLNHHFCAITSALLVSLVLIFK